MYHYDQILMNHFIYFNCVTYHLIIPYSPMTLPICFCGYPSGIGCFQTIVFSSTVLAGIFSWSPTATFFRWTLSPIVQCSPMTHMSSTALYPTVASSKRTD